MARFEGLLIQADMLEISDASSLQASPTTLPIGERLLVDHQARCGLGDLASQPALTARLRMCQVSSQLVCKIAIAPVTVSSGFEDIDCQTLEQEGKAITLLGPRHVGDLHTVFGALDSRLPGMQNRHELTGIQMSSLRSAAWS